MKERPIIFSGAMVRAILDDKKSQTRRVVRNPEEPPKHWNYQQLCPYGVACDRLWVKETFYYNDTCSVCGWAVTDATPCPCGDCATGPLHYKADEKLTPPVWRPSIYMPRWASRITLEIVSVRCQYLQEISGKDAEAEGIDPMMCVGPGCAVGEDGCNAKGCWGMRDGFRELWDSINAKRGYSWDTNPLVWAIEFRRVTE